MKTSKHPVQKEFYHYVVCPLCGEHHDTDEVAFVNIEEDFHGRDVMTFICPVKEAEAKSNVFRGY